MTLGELTTRTLERAGEDPAAPAYYTAAEAQEALGEAERFFCLLTLCLESQSVVLLQPATTFYFPRSALAEALPHWLVPLRIETAGGARLRPARLAELDALSAGWQNEPGAPLRYGAAGLDLIWFWRQPAEETGVVITYARGPVPLTAAGQTPEIPEEHQQLLIDYALPRLRVKEGGQELAKVMPALERFLAGAEAYGEYIRRRSLDLRYDVLPFELRAFDRSRLLASWRKSNSWLMESKSRKEAAPA